MTDTKRKEKQLKYQQLSSKYKTIKNNEQTVCLPRSNDYVCVYSASESDNDDSGRQKLNLLIKKYKTCGHGNTDLGKSKVIGISKRLERENSDDESKSEFKCKEEKWWSKLKQVKSTYSKGSKKNQFSEDVVGLERSNESEECDSDEEVSEEYIAKPYANAKVGKKKMGNIQCELCHEIFRSDSKLDDHYMTHFKTIKGLNTFLNKKRKQKAKLLCSQKNSHSILKHSKKKKSGVMKKVMFEMDVDEGVDCGSPEINSSEALEVLFVNEDSNEKINKGYEMKLDTKLKKQKLKDKKVKNQIKEKVKTVTSKSATANMNENYISKNLTFDVNGEKIYCDHNIDIARSCLLNDLKVMLNPLNLVNVRSKSNTEDNRKVKEKSFNIMRGNSSVFNTCHKNHTLIESSNIHNVNIKENGIKLKLKLKKENKYELSVKKNRSNPKLVQSNVPRLKLKRELPQTITDSAGHLESETIPGFVVSNSFCPVSINGSKSLQEGQSWSAEKIDSQKCVLNLSNIKKGLLCWTKEFQKMKSITENIAKHPLLEKNIGADKGTEMNMQDNMRTKREGSKEKASIHKNESIKDITTFKCNSIRSSHERKIDEADIESTCQLKSLTSEQARHSDIKNYVWDQSRNIVSKNDKYRLKSKPNVMLPEKHENTSEFCMKEDNLAGNSERRCRKTETKVEYKKTSRERERSVQNYHTIDDDTVLLKSAEIADNSRQNLNKIKLIKTIRKHPALSKEFISSTDDSADEDNEVINKEDTLNCKLIGETNSRKDINLHKDCNKENKMSKNSSEKNVDTDDTEMIKRESTPCHKNFIIKEKSKDYRIHEVQVELKKMQSNVSPKENKDIDMNQSQYRPSDEQERNSQGDRMNVLNLVSQDISKQHMDEPDNETIDILNVSSDVNNDRVLKSGSFILEPAEDEVQNLQHACYDDILNEFAEAVGIVLNSPDEAALMFDENVLYENLENFSLKDSLICDDSASILDKDENESVENLVNSCEEESLANGNDSFDVFKKNTCGSEFSLDIVGSQKQVNKLTQEFRRHDNNSKENIEIENVKVDDIMSSNSFVSPKVNTFYVGNDRHLANKDESVLKSKEKKEVETAKIKVHLGVIGGASDENRTFEKTDECWVEDCVNQGIDKKEACSSVKVGKSDKLDIDHGRNSKHTASKQTDEIVENSEHAINNIEKTGTNYYFEKEQGAKTRDNLNSHSSHQNNANASMICGVGEVATETEQVCKFYRCDGCRTLFYGVKKKELSTCVTCKDRMSKKTNVIDQGKMKESRKMKVRFENEERPNDRKSGNDCKGGDEIEISSHDSIDRDQSNSPDYTQTQDYGLSNRTTKSLSEKTLDNEKRVKIVLQKMKTPFLKSEDFKFIGSPDRKCWVVKKNEKKVTPLKVTCSTTGNKVEKVKSYNVERKPDINSKSQSCQTENELVNNESKSRTTKGKEQKKNECAVDVQSLTNITNSKNESSSKRKLITTKLKVETKQSQLNQIQKKAAYIDVPNEFEKALWNDLSVKRNEKGKKKVSTKTKTKDEDDNLEKLQAENRMMLLQRKNINKLSSETIAVQHFQKSKTAQRIYNNDKRKNFTDDLPDFSATNLDLTNLPPLSVSQKGISLNNDTSGDCVLLGYKKELNLSETSSSPSNSPTKFVEKEAHTCSNSNVADEVSFTEVCSDRRKLYGKNDKEKMISPECTTQINDSSVEKSIAKNLDIVWSKNDEDEKDDVCKSIKERGYSEDLKDLKKELETIVMKKDSGEVNNLKPFNPGFASTSPWRKESNGNNSISVLPSFSETFSKKPPISASINQTFNGFTISERNSGSNVTRISTETTTRYSETDHDSTFTELSDQGVNLDSLSYSPYHSVFSRLGKRKGSEDSTSTIFSVQEPLTLLNTDGDMSPVYSPEVMKTTSWKDEEEIGNDFSSTPAVKLVALKSMFDDSQEPALDISHISRCSSTGNQEEVMANEVSLRHGLNAVDLKTKRRKIKRLEIPEPVPKATCEQANKNKCQDTNLSSMMIISAECSQIDLSKLEKTTCRKSLPESEIKEKNHSEMKEDSKMHHRTNDDTVCEKATDCLKFERDVVETNETDRNDFEKVIKGVKFEREVVEKTKNNLTLEGEDKIEFSAVEDNYKAISDIEGQTDVKSNDGENVNSITEYTVKKKLEQTVNDKITRDINSNVECVINKNIRKAVEDIKESMVENNGESAIEHDGERAIENNEETFVKDKNSQTDCPECSNTRSSDENNEESVEETDSSSNIDSDEDNNDGEDSIISEDEGSTVERDVKENEVDVEERLDDILDIYASDEDASFLLDYEQPPVASRMMGVTLPDKATKVEDSTKFKDIKENKTKSVKESCQCRDISENRTNHEITNMKLDSNSVTPESLKISLPRNVTNHSPPAVLAKGQQVLPVSDKTINQNCYQQVEIPLFQPMKSNPLKSRWMPSGWCFRYFNNKPCSLQCSFRHDFPTQDVLNRCLPDIIKHIKKGDLNSAMNMLESHNYFQQNIPKDDLDCLYGYSVNHLIMEYCHKLLHLIANRKLVKQGHIDDIIFLWKRLHCEDVKPLNDAFYIAKESKLYPNPRAVLVLLEAFLTYCDVYMLWDVITYCTINEDHVIPQQFINKAISMLITCRDTYILSSAVTWLQKISPEQRSNINIEILSTLANQLQKRFMIKLADSVRQCLEEKSCSANKNGQQNLPTSNCQTNYTNANVGLDKNKQRTTLLKSKPVTPSNPEFLDLINLQTNIEQQLLNQNCARTVTQVEHDNAPIMVKQNEGERTVLIANPPRMVTQRKVSYSHFSESGKQSFGDQDIQNEIKLAFDARSWSNLADIFLLCCKIGNISPDVFEQFQKALITHHTIIGDVWTQFIDHIKQKQKNDPDLRLDIKNLSVLGSEIFYYCYKMDLFDAKEVLLVILNTEFLSLSQYVSRKWNVCLELEAAEFLSKTGVPAKAAQIVLDFSATSLEFAGAKDRLSNLVKLLIEQLYMEESFPLAYQLFCLAFSWNHRGLRGISSDLIKSCLQAELVDIPVQIYQLYIAESRKFDVREMVKRSLLNALVENKLDLRKSLYLDMKQSSSLFLEQSCKKPHCIVIQSLHTCNEMKVIIEQYLIDLYKMFCDQFVSKARLSSEELSLDVTVKKIVTTQGHPVQLPYVGQVQMSPLLVKVILLTEFGIHSDLKHNGNAKVSIHPDSLEKYMKKMDINSKKIGLEFSWFKPCQNGKRQKIQR